MLKRFQKIPGASTFSKQTDLPVLLPYQANSSGDPVDLRFSRWLTSFSPWLMLVLFLFVSLILLWLWLRQNSQSRMHFLLFGAGCRLLLAVDS